MKQPASECGKATAENVSEPLHGVAAEGDAKVVHFTGFQKHCQELSLLVNPLVNLSGGG